MQSKTQKPYTIVVGVDYSEWCALALAESFAIAAQKSPGGEPHVINVAPKHGNLPDGFAGTDVEQASNQLETYVQAQIAKYTAQYPSNREFERVVTHQRTGNPADEIVQLAVDLEADLIMVGTHSRRGIERLLLGSVAERVVRIAPCPVLVVRPKADSNVPEIEPPCPHCVVARQNSEGKELWCAQHSERHGRRHTYHYLHRNMAETNMPLVSPRR